MADIAEDDGGDYESNTMCFLCCEEMGPSRLAAVGACNHRGACAVCYYRLRKLMNDSNCVFCKQDLEQVMCVDPADERRFEEFSIWGDNAGPDHAYEEKSRMFFPKPYYESEILKLEKAICWVPDCPRGQKPFRNAKELEKHTEAEHGLSFCHICMKHKKSFLAEMPLFTPEGFMQHLKQGDPASGFEGHPK
uniref:RING-type domain-containing protein n=2 Tax=Phaeomonas parva TaxID=124430 RepID=A0A7S1TRD1_9STRA|mmetsp:Transcript_14264/g.42724  ORF Transcript_14264/g.42724 Transcript_14264/m.42724 type:complete len:192 (+) Transcript_14264:264-839(+)